MSEIRTNTISAANGTDPVTLTKQSAAKAYARWSMTGTAANVDSFNISSFTDIFTGICKQTLTSDMSDGNYTNVTTSGESDGGGNRLCGVNGSYSAPNASHTHFALYNSSLSLSDVNYGAASWLGDLA